ncbi:MAG: hypothetical protein DMF68_19135 [Acidobacteria bacterium]|nr:MAG: hypothetical protein DMF68_19135 [Acidobacteriota bacterium]
MKRLSRADLWLRFDWVESVTARFPEWSDEESNFTGPFYARGQSYYNPVRDTWEMMKERQNTESRIQESEGERAANHIYRFCFSFILTLGILNSVFCFSLKPL